MEFGNTAFSMASANFEFLNSLLFPSIRFNKVIDNGFRDCADFWEEKISYICNFLNFFY